MSGTVPFLSFVWLQNVHTDQLSFRIDVFHPFLTCDPVCDKMNFFIYKSRFLMRFLSVVLLQKSHIDHSHL